MANFTPNYNLKKPLGSENYNVADQNGNMDIIDTALNGIENGLAIIATGNTHAAITAGYHVYVRRHSTLSEGLYKANSNIAANATLTTSNLTAAPGGLGADVASLNSNITTVTYNEYIINETNYSGKLRVSQNGKVVAIDIFDFSFSETGQYNIKTGLPASKNGTHGIIFTPSGDIVGPVWIDKDQGMLCVNAIHAYQNIYGSIVYIAS